MPRIISDAIEYGNFFEKDALNDAIDHAEQNDGTLHVMGLLSDKAIHSHIDHLYGVLELASRRGFDRVAIHPFLDGRDTEPKVAKKYLAELDSRLEKLPGEICTVSGRYYAMDRDGRWSRTEQAYRAIIQGDGRTAGSAAEAVDRAYERGESDEFVQPTVIKDCPVEEGDSVFIFNFRADRCRQLTRSLIEGAFSEFESNEFDDLYVASMTRYSDEFDNPVAFEKEPISNTLGEVLGSRGLRQYRIAESEKYAHVTYFFSGRREEPFPSEEREIFPSPKVDVYNKTPAMRAEAITEKAVDVIGNGEHDFVLVNFSNCDMVGHTGDFDATVEAVEVVDDCIKRLFEECRDSSHVLMVTADHGNADHMKDDGNGPLTAHSYSRVPFILADDRDVTFHEEPELWRIAPAILAMNDEDAPEEMSEPLFI
jgi:2,3-bisphosphoglycerate-independent phosphoglycerate mutase